MKIALVIGHKASSGGAMSPSGVSEFLYNEDLVSRVASNLADTNIEVLIFYRKSYSRLPEEINKTNPDIVISFHCNAYNGQASGSEVLYYWLSTAGKKIATVLQKAIHNCLRLPDRGVKPKRTEDRGGYILKYVNAPCVILEPFFIDNEYNYQIGIEKKPQLALAISDEIIEICK